MLNIRFIPLLLGLLLAAVTLGAQARIVEGPPEPLAPTAEQRQATRIILQLMRLHHYKRVDLDDALSREILDRYLEALDPNHNIFLQSDIEAFQRWRDRLDDDLRKDRLEAPFEIFQRFLTRLGERIAYTESLLEEGRLDFQREEYYRYDRSEAAWPANRKEADEIWRKRVKNDWLSLRLSGKEEKEIPETLRKRYDTLLGHAGQYRSEDIYQLYINAYTAAVEPHTAYFSPRSSENFNINMSLSLEGIGAALRTSNEYTVVVRVIPGGPAALSGQLQPEDRIVAVAQGTDGPFIDVIGWRLSDVVDLIRGAKGSVVRLHVLPKGAPPDDAGKRITLVRDKIQLEQQAAHAYLLEELEKERGIRVGVIEIPSFYLDIEGRINGEQDYRSTTRDVRRLLVELREQKVDAIVIDLRGNGGGSLEEATLLTGLFIPSGPVVQIRDSRGRVTVKSDPHEGVSWEGPLAVLVDRFSASASEIFAGAIQDYGRGLVLGEPTFGKGTVQTLVDLKRWAPAARKPLGQLKLTTAQFFRVNGDSTQFQGVVPDILFPGAEQDEDFGERAYDNALPWAHIRPAYFRRVGSGNPDLEQLRERHRQRVAKDAGFRFLLAELELMKEMEMEELLPLKADLRQAQRDRRQERIDTLEEGFLATLGLPEEMTEEERNRRLDEEIDRIVVREAGQILIDLVTRQLHQAGEEGPAVASFTP